MRCIMLCLSALVILVGCGTDRVEAGETWVASTQLKLLLQKDEVPKKGCDQIRGVFYGDGDPKDAMGTLFNKEDVVVAELRALAGGITLTKRAKEKGVQTDGRTALVWWNLKNSKYRRASAEKDNTFNMDTDRLMAAVAVLDSKAVFEGTWVKNDELTLLLPEKWMKPKSEGGFGFPEDWERTQGVGPGLGGILPMEMGNFTGEQLGWNGFRMACENRIAVWMHKHPDDRVAVLIVYEYDKDKTPRCPTAYRYYAVSASGTLDVQINGGIGTNKNGMTIARDKGDVVFPRIKK